MNCRVCGTPLNDFLDLGDQPLANSYLTDPHAPEQTYPLHARVCPSCLLVQCDPTANPGDIFTDYAFESHNSKPWIAHCMAYAHMIQAKYKPRSVIEIGSNDGILLEQFYQHVEVLGVDPAKMDTGKIPTINAFWTTELAGDVPKADLIIANNVIGHVPDINDFFEGVRIALKPEGVATIETPHLLQLIQHCQYDTIYHEHYNYWSLHALEMALKNHGLVVTRLEELAVHGGSLRLYVEHRGRSLGDGTVFGMRVREHEAGLWQADSPAFTGFSERVAGQSRLLSRWLHNRWVEGAFVAGAGAPAKANTLLNTAGITSRDLSYTTDTSLSKQGKYMPGSHVPIHAPDAHQAVFPDYILVLAWNWWDAITHSLRDIPATFVNPTTL